MAKNNGTTGFCGLDVIFFDCWAENRAKNKSGFVFDSIVALNLSKAFDRALLVQRSEKYCL
jgi:hypothetical protein